jgi:hypothetical protein
MSDGGSAAPGEVGAIPPYIPGPGARASAFFGAAAPHPETSASNIDKSKPTKSRIMAEILLSFERAPAKPETCRPAPNGAPRPNLTPACDGAVRLLRTPSHLPRESSRAPSEGARVMAKSPMTQVKEKFGDKKKLVEEVEKFTSDDLWVSRTNADKGLAHVSNAKLLRLHRIFSEVKAKFGTRDKLVAAILELTKRGRDEGYKAALAKYPVPRLYDLFKSTSKRTGAGQPAADAKPAKKVAPKNQAKAAEAKPAKKAAAKKSAAKKA